MSVCKVCAEEKPPEAFYPRWRKCKLCVSKQRTIAYHAGIQFKGKAEFLLKEDGTKVCRKCKLTLPKEKFYEQKNTADLLTARCRQCYYLYTKKWNEANKARYNDSVRRCNRKLRLQVLAHYGLKCACCGEAREEFLNIDHINNDGAAHRKGLDMIPGMQFYRWLRRNNYPKEFRTLCWNCNCSRGTRGYCPHEVERGESKPEKEVIYHRGHRLEDLIPQP